jgi:hypothetical protein
MIDARELRIGNLIDKGGVAFRVLTIDEDGCMCEPINEYDAEDNSWHLSRVEPIPLTEEWLLRLGFTKTEYNDGVEMFMFIYFHLELRNNHLYLECEDSHYSRNLKHIKYVHQLQNLYHSLTESELKIKEDGKNKLLEKA